MPVGLYFDGMSPLHEFVGFAKEAEGKGVDSIWAAEHFGYRDGFVCASAVLQSTRAIRVIPGPISPYAHHPMSIAMGVATLSELAPGRVGLNIGTGNITAQSEFGVKVAQPVHVMGEAIAGVRGLIRGDSVRFEGKHFSFAGARMGFSPDPVKIYMSAIGPRMISAAGRHADGLVLSAGVSPRFAAASLERASTARRQAEGSTGSFTLVCAMVASAALDQIEAYVNAKRLLSYLFRVPVLEEDWKLNGNQVDHEAILSAIRRQDRETAMSYISDETVASHSVAGSPNQFMDSLQAYLDAGIDLPILLLQGSMENRALALDLALEVCGRREEF
jgi:5,10-methylenetetrahydromethanopterin reductase